MAEQIRTFWKGHLRLALVSIPIRLVTTEKAEAEVHFHQVDRHSKKRSKHIKAVPGDYVSWTMTISTTSSSNRARWLS